MGIVGLRIYFQIMAFVGHSASASVISLNVFCIITVLSTRIPDSCLIVLIPFVAFTCLCFYV
ncbi:hypothetical protein EDB87DRAFT_1602295, partial [Lactarius vividus]